MDDESPIVLCYKTIEACIKALPTKLVCDELSDKLADGGKDGRTLSALRALQKQAKDFSENYYKTLNILIQRYSEMIIKLHNNHCKNYQKDEVYIFAQEFKKACEERLPLMKLNRWLGYIQRYVIEKEMTTVEIERNYTRQFLRPLDFPK